MPHAAYPPRRLPVERSANCYGRGSSVIQQPIHPASSAEMPNWSRFASSTAPHPLCRPSREWAAPPSGPPRPRLARPIPPNGGRNAATDRGDWRRQKGKNSWGGQAARGWIGQRRAGRPSLHCSLSSRE
eukprot:gene7227-biopygen13106